MRLHRNLLTAAGVIAALLVFSPVFAAPQGAPDYAADAANASGDPPLIPHAVQPGQNGASCNACHKTGVGKAPPTEHPERLNCTQCHVQGEVRRGADKPAAQ